MDDLKPCPFCSGTDIRYSLKTKGARDIQYHAVMYCNSCHCYGKRTLTRKLGRTDYADRRNVQKDTDIKQGAIEAWNTRVL